MKALALSVAIGCALLLPVAVQAQSKPPKICKLPFEKIDVQKKGTISYPVFEKVSLTLIQKKGGEMAEFAAAHPDLAKRGIKRTFDGINTSHSGAITPAEWVACAERQS